MSRACRFSRFPNLSTCVKREGKVCGQARTMSLVCRNSQLATSPGFRKPCPTEHPSCCPTVAKGRIPGPLVGSRQTITRPHHNPWSILRSPLGRVQPIVCFLGRVAGAGSSSDMQVPRCNRNRLGRPGTAWRLISPLVRATSRPSRPNRPGQVSFTWEPWMAGCEHNSRIEI
jgi:hypothetical protein